MTKSKVEFLTLDFPPIVGGISRYLYEIINHMPANEVRVTAVAAPDHELFDAKQGFAIQSATALFQYLFNEKDARRLYAWVEDYNLASQKLCERLHMRREGCFKEFVSFERENGEKRYDNTYIYALLKKEWVQ